MIQNNCLKKLAGTKPYKSYYFVYSEKMISTFTENVFHGKLELNNRNRKLRMIDDLNPHIM